jgi:hypothetical protein
MTTPISMLMVKDSGSGLMDMWLGQVVFLELKTDQKTLCKAALYLRKADLLILE